MNKSKPKLVMKCSGKNASKGKERGERRKLFENLFPEEVKRKKEEMEHIIAHYQAESPKQKSAVKETPTLMESLCTPFNQNS